MMEDKRKREEEKRRRKEKGHEEDDRLRQVFKEKKKNVESLVDTKTKLTEIKLPRKRSKKHWRT